MPAPTWEDLDEFLDVDEFATPATVHRQDGAILSVVGIYDDPYLNAELGEYDMDTSRPALHLQGSGRAGRHARRHHHHRRRDHGHSDGAAI